MQSHIKNIIIQLRNSGKSYQEISDILDKDYDIHKSRQSIHGIYQRAIRKTSDKQVNEELETYDILHYISLGLSLQVVSDITNVSIYKIKQIVNTYNDKLDSIRKEQQEKAFDMFNDRDSLEVIMNKLNYKGQRPTKQLVRQLLSQYIDNKIEEYKVELISNMLISYTDTITREIIKASITDEQQLKMINKQIRQRNNRR